MSKKSSRARAPHDTRTSWGKVSQWYTDYLKDDDTYHAKVIAPNIIRVARVTSTDRILDIGCGEGYFTRILHECGGRVEGADISEELVAQARAQSPTHTFHIAPADTLSFADDHSFDVMTCILALQNIEHIEPVFKECARVLRPGGRFVFVLNHPAFRIPQSSQWGWDEVTSRQYRRIDRYLSASKATIDMHPGTKGKRVVTYSFHRSIQDYTKALSVAGFAITRIEEWISHRTSEKGPRQKAEDTARKEIPLFMCVEAQKLI